jgi:hypothetical protein
VLFKLWQVWKYLLLAMTTQSKCEGMTSVTETLAVTELASFLCSTVTPTVRAELSVPKEVLSGRRNAYKYKYFHSYFITN